jgi:hypothetical protein
METRSHAGLVLDLPSLNVAVAAADGPCIRLGWQQTSVHSNRIRDERHVRVAPSAFVVEASKLIYIFFINHYLSASLLQPDGVKHNMYDRLSHINK